MKKEFMVYRVRRISPSCINVAHARLLIPVASRPSKGMAEHHIEDLFKLSKHNAEFVILETYTKE